MVPGAPAVPEPGEVLGEVPQQQLPVGEAGHHHRGVAGVPLEHRHVVRGAQQQLGEGGSPHSDATTPPRKLFFPIKKK